MIRSKLELASLLIAVTITGLAYHNYHKGSVQPGVPEYVTNLHGLVEVDAFHIKPGTTLQLEEDLTVHAKGRVLIEGSIVASPRTEPGNAAGIRVSITSNESIIVLGDILAGVGSRAYDGATTLENCLLTGGNGGDVNLSAPAILINGRVIAGEGGLSGPNAEAPAGGNVRIEGIQYTTRDESRLASELPLDRASRLAAPGGFGIFGGRGGSHLAKLPSNSPFAAGRGGRGGDVTCQWLPIQKLTIHTNQEWNLVCDFFEEHSNEASRTDLAGLATFDEKCPAGQPKAGPAPGFGGQGTTGTTGDNGTQMSAQGETGGPGGNGGDATGCDGDTGNPGNDCCDPLIDPGGTGGAGAPGQVMTGGKGGKGGTGGNGGYDTSIPGYAGPGGDGGPGGPGGAGTGGTGGQGGDGGKPGGSGGAGGAFGEGNVGPGGDGGDPGRGTEPGCAGATGPAGQGAANGNTGGGGNTGGQCDPP